MCSSIPGSARIEACRPLQTMWQYGSSEKTISSVPRTIAAIAARSSRVATPPVGLCGEFRRIARGLGSVARNFRTSSADGRNSFSTLSGTSTARAPRRSRLGTYVGNCGLKTRTPSPGSRIASAKYCSNGLAPEATTMFSAVAE